MSELERLIRQSIPLGKASGQGYETVKCAKCHDYKVRGGFKFTAEGIHYSCFNCGTSCGYTDNRRVSDKFRDVLRSFGISDDDITKASITLGQLKVAPKPKDVPKELGPPGVVALPPQTTRVRDNASQWAPVADAYLRLRGLNPDEFDYLVSEDPKYNARVIIPCYYRGSVVYWQARDMTGQSPARYLNPLISKNNILFNMDECYRHTDEPLFVTEGPFDALSIGKSAVALLGSSFTSYKLQALKFTRRPAVFIIDKDLNGFKLGNKVLDEGESLGWKVACLPESVEDANDALKQGLGRLWLISYIVGQACNGLAGRLYLKLNCKQG